MIGKAHALGFAQLVACQLVERLLLQLLFALADLLQVVEEPAVDLRQFVQFFDTVAVRQRVHHEIDALCRRHHQPAAQLDVVDVFRHAERTAHFERAQPFLKGFLEGAPDGHRFAYGFHLRAERRV